ncbi:putative gag-pol polyprotein [Cucumis melo var. makuwa]|uniref:Gag-pol polyprotein n=1 Tax=Cucumis melo var. makuwa TaxID=1194695 RepID=A0A5A7U7W7_CUCMM|nr:putative gag-pol polyprotein [Cucumis melo var. makuwa]
METINVVINDFESNVNQFNIEDDETHVTPDVTSTPLDEMPKGNVTKNKALLVAQGYAQVEGVDFDETFAPVATLQAIRLLLSISCFQKFKLFQMDIKSAFLDGYLNEEVYVAQPRGGETDKTLFINRTNTDLIIAQIYVDDITFGGFPKTLIKQRSEDMFISQEKYAKNLVKKFGLDQSQYKRAPAVTHAKITKDTVGTAVDLKLYRSMIGSLLHLTTSRPNIAYGVGLCARYQSDPHWAGSSDDQKSTSSGCFFLGNNLVSWFSKK